jgi:ABC-type histidine transport system ATPase subunit
MTMTMTKRSGPAIEVTELRKTYPGEVEAVKGISFDVAAGEVFGLLGPNGAASRPRSGCSRRRSGPRRAAPASRGST